MANYIYCYHFDTLLPFSPLSEPRNIPENICAALRIFCNTPSVWGGKKFLTNGQMYSLIEPIDTAKPLKRK